ncbi:hypothetical protein GCM10027167_81890 [Nocardia heshunensis]
MQELCTREQVAEYLRRAHVFAQDREIGMYQTEFAWVCWMPMTSAEQAAARRTPGTGGCYIVDVATGVVTSYGSAMHPLTWGRRYDQAVRAGEELPGSQIYPRPSDPGEHA